MGINVLTSTYESPTIGFQTIKAYIQEEIVCP